jgi:hypothetical protein
MSKKQTGDRIQKEKDYIAFLEKRLTSENFHRNELPEIVEMTKDKLKKAKLVLKCLEAGKGK